MISSKAIVLSFVIGAAMASAVIYLRGNSQPHTLRSAAEAQARVDVFKERYPVEIWTDQAAQEVSDQQEKIDDALNYIRQSEKLVKLNERGEADDFRRRARFQLQSVSMVEAERLLVCEKRPALIEQGGATFAGYEHVGRKGISENVVAKWCEKGRRGLAANSEPAVVSGRVVQL